MLMNKQMRKAIAATFLVIFSSSTFAPSISYAVTSGPTQPEATSFEPIDTTDMVNVQTGDFTYNIPLIEIPGPEGGYPLSLSYHAGLQPNEDASWVGYGWTLNPGAINRSVNGYPDDWYNPTTSSHVYWSGGGSNTYNVGVSVGGANVANVNAGLSFSQDTYRGFGVGFDVGFREGIGGPSSPLSANVGIGVSPYGDAYVSGGISVLGFSKGRVGGSAGINFMTDLGDGNTSIGFFGGIGYSVNKFKGSLLGGSMSTDGGKPSLSLGGMTSSVHNGYAGSISTKGTMFGIDIPTPWGFNISLGYNKQRYWTNETVGVETHGSYNTFSWNPPSSHIAPDDIAFDEYALLEDPSYKNIVDYPDPKVVQGGSFPDFDVYNVNAQGLGGNMRPYLYQAEILNQNTRLSSTTGYAAYFSPGGTYNLPSFRFENDFSNSYRQGYKIYDDPSSDAILDSPAPFEPPVYGNNDGTFGFNGALAGSKQVYVGIKVHPSNTLGYTGPRYTDGIEGYSITNESGVTYHFGLPAYSYGEENYQEKIGSFAASQGAFNRQTKGTPYAYTWYLTTVTGTDYVDRNTNGIADDGDWGYWVNFNYGKWADDYKWRNPSEGFRTDEDNKWQNCSMGKREVYYLNSIRTRTHTALFEKEVRYDAKGESALIFNKNGSAQNQDYSYPGGVFDNTSTSSLRLSHIYLLNSNDENIVTASSGTLSSTVLDKSDIDAVGRSNIETKSLKIIDFNHDYSLCPNTVNSYDIAGPSVKFGKLTLNSIATRGKSGASILPPTSFQYDLGGDARTQVGVILTADNFTTTNGLFEVGQLIRASASPSDYYCGVITSKTFQSPSTYVYTLANNSYSGGAITATVYTTKNPPYNKDAYDKWGNYKSDYNIATIASNESLGRQTSGISSNSTDVWSLRSVTSPLGNQFKINYESDSYSKTVATGNGSLLLSSFSNFDPSGYVSFTVNTAAGDKLSDFLSVGNKVDFVALQPLRYSPDPFCPSQSPACNINYLSPGGPYFDPDYSTTLALPSNYYYFRVIDTRPYGGAQIQAIDDANGILTVSCSGLVPNLGPANNKIEYAGGQISYTGINTTRNLAPVSGNLFFTQVRNINGGGIRVQSISIINSATNQISTTNYDYRSIDNVSSSGVTSYDPSGLNFYDISKIETNNNLYPYQGGSASPAYRKLKYTRVLYNQTSALYSIARELPPPGVMYEYVKISKQIKNADESEPRNIDGYTQYQIEVFRSNMVGRVDIPGSSSYTTTTGRTQAACAALDGTIIKTHNLAILKFIGSIGNIRRITTYDSQGRKISETINHYLHDNIINEPLKKFMDDYKALLGGPNYNYQGYLQERYTEVKDIIAQPNPADIGIQATLSAREQYPCINTGQTIINYINRTQASVTNLAYDYYSGAVTKSIETDSYGNNILTESVPAYRNYTVMGPKMDGNSNATKNMLIQTAQQSTWKLDAAKSKTGLISSSVTTWSDLVTALGIDGTAYTQNGGTYGDVWRMKSTYSFMPAVQTTDGITPMANVVDFNWASPSGSSADWKNTSNITLYDVFSKALETNDINNIYSAVKMDFKDKRMILRGGAAKFSELAYSGAEDDAINQSNTMFVRAGDGTLSTTAFHSGTQSLLLGVSGKKGFLYTVPVNSLTAGKTYQASVWVKPTTGSVSDLKLYYDVNGTIKGSSTSSGSPSPKIGANGWILLNLIIKGVDMTAGSTLNVYCQNDHASVQGYADDFRFQPINASATAYVYDPFSGELTHMLDNSNLYSRFAYDGAGRLTAAYKEKLGVGEFKVKDYQYNYSASKWTNDLVNAGFTKSCTAGQIGSVVSVLVPAGTFTSFVSKPDANTKATQYAQDYANSQGTCTQLASVTCNNTVHASGFSALFTNTVTGSPYLFSIPAAGGIIGYLPDGTYNITISKSGNATTYTFNSGCGTSYITGTSASFTSSSITLNSSCNTILISYPL